MSVGLRCYKLAKRIQDKLAMLLFRGSFHEFGRRSVLALPFRSGNESRISIGSGVFVGPGSWIEVMSDNGSGHHSASDSPVIILEDDVSISGDCTITAVTRVIIGKGALIARFVYISDHSHATSDPERPIKSQGFAKIAAVVIGEGAWLGHGVVICPGVTIGRNAVIGANSVVRENVPEGCVAVGAPAKIIRFPASSATIAETR